MRSDLVRVLSGQQPLAPAVVSRDDGYGGYNDGPRRHRGKIVIGLAALVVGLLALAGYLIFDNSAAPQQVEVPILVGQQSEAAAEKLQAVGLTDTTETVASPPDQAGLVVSTDPGAGTAVDEGSVVRLRIGSGTDQTTVPPLVGLTVDQARQALADHRLVLGAQTEQEDQDPTKYGTIISSEPASGAPASAGGAVAVVVGKQPEPSPSRTSGPRPSPTPRTTEPTKTTVAVPDVVGRNADDAQRTLEQAGFTVHRTKAAGGTANEVAGTDPAAGTQVSRRSTVTLQVSTGACDSADVPDVRGDRIDQARARLTAAGFSNVSVDQGPTSDPNELGRVLDQSPSPGKSNCTDDQITLTVGVPGGDSTATN